MGSTGGHKIFRVLDTPNSPEATPQEEILEYACDWADGANTVDATCDDIVGAFSGHYDWDYDCHLLSSDFTRLVSSLGISASLHKWARKGSTGSLGDMVGQKTKAIDPVGSYGSQQYLFSFHQWAETGSQQRDPTTASSYSGTWGDYEDYLYTQYEEVTDTSPYTTTWVNNQNGQSSGCEAPSHRIYTNPSASPWRGPDSP